MLLPKVINKHSHTSSSQSQRMDSSSKTLPSSPDIAMNLAIAPSQLDLILAKLHKLNTIKIHLNAIDNRLNILQPQPSIMGLLA